MQPIISKLKYYGLQTYHDVPVILQNKSVLRSILNDLGVYKIGKYFYDHYTNWLSAYAQQSSTVLQNYFTDKLEASLLYKNFIRFCFANGIALNREKTLQSLNYHNVFSDEAIKKKLQQFKRKDEVNMLGFGSGDGAYEKEIAQYLVEQDLAKSVKIYGFDPIAVKPNGIELLTREQLAVNTGPKFDLIIARWVLHHVITQQRWSDFINCINRSKPGAMVLIIEHGFLPDDVQLFDKKIYHFLNATLDIITNIAIHLTWFSSTASNIGENFFIDYLEPGDFAFIKNNVSVQIAKSNIYDIGPIFPNQTICCYDVT